MWFYSFDIECSLGIVFLDGFVPGADLGFQRAGELLGVRALFSGVEGT